MYDVRARQLHTTTPQLHRHKLQMRIICEETANCCIASISITPPPLPFFDGAPRDGSRNVKIATLPATTLRCCCTIPLHTKKHKVLRDRLPTIQHNLVSCRTRLQYIPNITTRRLIILQPRRYTPSRIATDAGVSQRRRVARSHILVEHHAIVYHLHRFGLVVRR
jgi:hypothetical protein